MKSIYQEALGEDFNKLHARVQERFALTSADRHAAIGEGTMEEIWHGRAYTLPFLYVGTLRHILFPECGCDVPFRIENWAYKDPLGRETVTWLRTFDTSPQRRFDAYMTFDHDRHCVVDYLGTHQHLAVDLDLSVDPRGGIRFRSGALRFYEGPLGFRFPRLLSGFADVCEWFDDEIGRYRIEVDVTNDTWGPLFGYRGTFDVQFVDAPSIPADAIPRRLEARA